MEKRRSTRRRRSSERVLMILLVAVVLIGCAVGGTIAYFTDTTDAVTNTFAVGAIGKVELGEEDASSKFGDNYVIVPGVPITKDPTVTYTPEYTDDANKELNVGAYIFVKVSGGNWTKDATNNYTFSVENGAMTWNVNSADWTYLQDNIYYHAVQPNTKEVFSSQFIDNDTITVSGTLVTNDTLSAVQQAANNLKFEAFAVQYEGFTDAADAWSKTFGATP